MLPPAAAAASSIPFKLQQVAAEMLLQQALPAALPAAVTVMQELLCNASTKAPKGSAEHSADDAEEEQIKAYVAAAEAVLADGAVQQLL